MRKSSAVCYMRYSPRPSAADCQSNEVQLAECRAYCKDRGYRIVGEFSDKAASGDDIDRPGLWDAVAAVPRGGVLIVAKVDRLARSVNLDGYIRTELAKRKATVEAADGSTPDDSAEAIMLRQMLAAIAEYNKRITAARTRAAMLHAQASGKAMSKEPPIGKRRVGSELVDNPEEQAAISIILEDRKAGRTFQQIADRLNASGVSARGKCWHNTGVRNVVRRFSKSI